MRTHTPFAAADPLTVNINWKITAPRRPAKQLRNVVYLLNTMTAHEIMNLFMF